MRATPTYEEICDNYHLWGEYFDTQAIYSREEFEDLSYAEKHEMIVACCGEEEIENE